MHLVIGTSGHIDHGKTTLVKALTGVDTDRFAEEKQRGITIDIGFASLQVDDVELSFVDVPGHERFVHNMLAGAAGIDAVLMVVGADEGVMPQTVEHMHICDLLGIKRGVIALTRCDLADDELIELVEDDVRSHVADTFLADAPILRVSAVTGQGLDALRDALAALAGQTQARELDQPFRFPVDRSFSMKGFGTVVTGTVVTGRLGKDDTVVQYPAGRPLRIRGMQVHGEPADAVEAGQRAAINLTGVTKEEIHRGDQLAAEGSLLTSYLLNVELRLLKDIPRDLTQRTRIRLHQGTREVIGRIVLLDEERFRPGETQLIQVRLEEPVSTRYGDRFIIRNFSPVFTLGGGRIIDPAPNKSRRARQGLGERLKALAGDEPEALVEQVIQLQSTRGVVAHDGAARTGLSDKAFARAVQQLSSENRIFCVDPERKKYIHEDSLARIAALVERLLAEHHRAFPEREGMSRAELAGKLSLIFADKEVGNMLQRLVKRGRLNQTGQAYQLQGHEKNVSGEQERLLTDCIAAIEAGGVQPARRTALFETMGVDEKTGMQVLRLGTHNERLVRVKDDLYYTPAGLAQIEAQLRAYLLEHGEITVIDFKDLTGVTRKHAVDLLEHFDAAQVTLRLDNHRVLRQSAAAGSGA